MTNSKPESVEKLETKKSSNKLIISFIIISVLYAIFKFSNLALPSTQVHDLSKAKVIMYSTTACRYCKQARYFFNYHKISYYEYNIDKSTLAREKYTALSGYGTPLILVGKYRLNGFNERFLTKILLNK